MGHDWGVARMPTPSGLFTLEDDHRTKRTDGGPSMTDHQSASVDELGCRVVRELVTENTG
jgi:hypothetical protein